MSKKVIKNAKIIPTVYIDKNKIKLAPFEIE